MVKKTVKDIKIKKKKCKVSVLTCYDYSFARILDQAGIDILLVGDSLANVVLGLKETRRVSIGQMLEHTKAVARGVEEALVVADMPYAAYQKDPRKAFYYASKFIACGADAVKVEWFKDCEKVVRGLIKKKIPVMGHIGLTPQTAHLLGGCKVQGRDKTRALEIFQQAKILEKLGVFSIVLELVPWQVAKNISEMVKVPTIGIGAGKYCDGQVLVLYDFLGISSRKKLKFVRVYDDLGSRLSSAASKYIKDVQRGEFPAENESFE